MHSRPKEIDNTLDISTSSAAKPASPITSHSSNNRKRKQEDADFDFIQGDAKKRRLEQNRAYNRKSRKKKTAYIKELQSTIASQANEIHVLNNQLKQQAKDIFALNKHIRHLLLPPELRNCELFADYNTNYSFNPIANKDGYNKSFLAMLQQPTDSPDAGKIDGNHSQLTTILDAPNLQFRSQQTTPTNYAAFFKPQSMKIRRYATKEMDENKVIEKRWEF